MEEGEPNFAYELDEAVADHYLVNYHGFKRGSLIMKEGIKYDKLTEEEKRQLELVWEYEQINGRDIASSEIFSYIFNEDTIDAVLQELMEHGLKVQSGERIGKTVIFAYNHHHAELIVNRFNVLYPEYGPSFCVLIDNYITYAHDLIDKFEIRNADPQIAVSVDMLDTGIDVPDILNLVFFKPVKSKIKFLQMIGRGTRLSENIFGPDKHKECFYIFDWCGNFDYFDQNPDGHEAPVSQSLTERLFCLRSEIAFHLQHQQYQEDEYCKSLHDAIKALLYEQVHALSDSHISVRMKWSSVSHFKEKDSWTYISDLDLTTLKNDIAPLLPKSTLDESAKKFDVLALTIELGCLDQDVNPTKSIQRVKLIAKKLEEMATLPQVQAKMGTIKEVLSDVAWQNVSLQWLEKVRMDLRDLMKFLLGDRSKWFVVDIEDVISDDGEIEGVTPKVSYKQRVMDYLAANRHLPVLDKIYNMEELEYEDFRELQRILWNDLGSKDEYHQYTQGKMCGDNVAILIRSLIGVDRKVAMQRFGSFISGMELNLEQEEFLMTIISYVCENGDITREIVACDPPFDERLDVFDNKIPLVKFIDNIHHVILPLYPTGEYSYTLAADE